MGNITPLPTPPSKPRRLAYYFGQAVCVLLFALSALFIVWLLKLLIVAILR